MKHCFYIIILVFLIACSGNSIVDGETYMKYIENEKNELLKTKTIEDVKFQLLFCSSEYMLLKEKKENLLLKEDVQKRKNENDSMMFFKLRIVSDKTNDIIGYKINSDQNYYDRVNYLSFSFEQDIALVTDKDTLFPAIFHFERNYGIAPYADFIIGFDEYIKNDFQILIDDRVFESGLIKFSYSKKNIDNIPHLKTI